jgi:hypothetical protein
MNIEGIGPNELISHVNPSERVYSGGFSVNSILMKYKMSPIVTFNTKRKSNQKGGEDSIQVSDLFDSLVIPNWALSYNKPLFGLGGSRESHDTPYNCDMMNEIDSDSDTDSDDCIDEDLHDKLLSLVKHEKKSCKKSSRSKGKEKKEGKEGKESKNTTRRKKDNL